MITMRIIERTDRQTGKQGDRGQISQKQNCIYFIIILIHLILERGINSWSNFQFDRRKHAHKHGLKKCQDWVSADRRLWEGVITVNHFLIGSITSLCQSKTNFTNMAPELVINHFLIQRFTSQYYKKGGPQTTDSNGGARLKAAVVFPAGLSHVTLWSFNIFFKQESHI